MKKETKEEETPSRFLPFSLLVVLCVLFFKTCSVSLCCSIKLVHSISNVQFTLNIFSDIYTFEDRHLFHGADTQSMDGRYGYR